MYRHRVKTVLKKRVIKPYNPSAFPKGINLIGPFKAQIGLGQSCRLLGAAVKASGIDYTFENFDLIGTVQNGDSTYDSEFKKETPYGINIIHMEPTELMLRCIEFDENLWNERYNIAFWLWELEEFPKEWTPAIDLVDEIWTPSEFTSESIRKVTDKPVITIAHRTPGIGELPFCPGFCLVYIAIVAFAVKCLGIPVNVVERSVRPYDHGIDREARAA